MEAPLESPLRLSPIASEQIRVEVERAGGREVCFLSEVDELRVVTNARAVARGNRSAVLAVARDAPEGALLIHNHPSGVLEPSRADLSVAARCWEDGLGTAIVDNEATRLYVVVEPPRPRIRTPLDLVELDGLLGPAGPLAAFHPGYEDREGQRDMLRTVAERYNEGGIAVVEAGTGTGKSLAYLLPAARWAARNGDRTVISTNTINLQEQLVGKDLPLVKELLGEEETVQWALVKGRGNYLSIRRAHLALRSGPSLFDEDRTSELEAIVKWVRTTQDGSRSDLPFAPSDDTWEEVRSDPDICLRARCPHFQSCFYQQARRRAASAELLVVNHHLLFTDLAVRRATDNFTQAAVLPAYHHVILDEAHNLEDAATEHLGVRVTVAGIHRVLGRLDRRGKGILGVVLDAYKGHQELPLVEVLVEERIRPALEATREAVGELGASVETILLARPQESLRIGGDAGIPEPVRTPRVAEAHGTLLSRIAELVRVLERLRRNMESMLDPDDPAQERTLDLQSVVRRLDAHHFALRLVLTPSDEETTSYVRWVDAQRRGRRSNLLLAAAPIELAGMLRESLFEKAASTVLTSATLATRKSFEFLETRLGLAYAAGTPAEMMAEEKPLEVIERIVSSPFDFSEQTVLAVPTDLPDAGGGGERHHAEVARVTEDLAELTEGGLFVLFTSYRALRRAAEDLRKTGTRWPLFVQGDEPRARLLEKFVRSGDGILLGTSSFWEGVDVPGDPLRGLIIQKLPFRVPTEPVTAARIEAIERRGGNAFAEYLLPLAALRLKQGFGRLVRSRTDRGAVVLLDDRIVRKRYGRYLRDSLPDAPLIKGPWAELRRPLREFYGFS